MRKNGAWIVFVALLQAVAGQQAQLGEPVKPSGDKGGIVPVSRLEAFRISLGKAKEIQTGWCFPDMKENAELSKETEDYAAASGKPFKVLAGHNLCGYEAPADHCEELRLLLADPASFVELDAKEQAEPFIAAHYVSWNTDSVAHHALISLRQKQILFVQGETRSRHSLARRNHDRIKRPFWHWNFERAELAEAKPVLDSLASDTPISIHEGSRHNDPELEKKRGIVELGFFRLYKTGHASRDLRDLRSLLAKEGTLIPWGGGKACGGFSPDFGLTWGEGDEQMTVLICLTCHEIRLETHTFSLLYDIGDDVYSVLKEELERFRSGVH